MTTRPFSTSLPYLESIRGLLRLHALSESDRDDSTEAEAIRDGLERPWMDLSETEKKRITGLSEDLYSLNESSGQLIPMNPEAQQRVLEAIGARLTGDWDAALELLRRSGKFLDPAELSVQRGFVWREAGDNETAAVFFRHPARLKPDDERLSYMDLSTLFKIAPDAAHTRAQQILSTDEIHPPIVVALAANIRIMCSLGTEADEARPVLHQLIEILERTLQRLQHDDTGQSSTSRTSHAIVTSLLGSCFQRLGDVQTSLRYCNYGLEADPENEWLLVARGILRYGVGTGAIADFEQAIHQGATMVWPYFFLAHQYLVDHRFDECRRMCERALALPASDEVRANLNEWLAIAETELGFPAELVRSAFETAIRLAPEIERIQQNLEEFEKAVGQHKNRRVPWISPNDAVVREVGRAGYVPIPA
jgi:tetratricopeptide (TPR) repeat protein